MDQDDKESKKRNRTTNFTASEKMLLINLVSTYKNIIENKKNDNVTTQEKNRAWVEITRKFNATATTFRSSDTLKRLYENQKKYARKTAAEEKKELYLIGGGVATKVKKEVSHDLILSVMNEKSVFGLAKKFDSNNRGLSSCESNLNYANEAIEVIIDDGDDRITEKTIENETRYNIMGEFQPNDSYSFSVNESSMSPNSDNNENELLIQVIGEKIFKKPADIQNPLSKELKRGISDNVEDGTPIKKAKKTYNSSRRRPATSVKALTTSVLSEKYNLLVEKRLQIANIQKQNLEGTLGMTEEEHRLKVELLEVQLKIEKEKLKILKDQN